MTFNELFLTIAIILLFIIIIIYLLFDKIRERVLSRELCWFCHNWNQVLLKDKNSWNCSFCQQYNGFSQDGNYNKIISAQFDESKNTKQYCRQIPDSYSKSGQLCNECNVNQEIKVKLLAEFMPFNETNFSQECDEYKKHLEKEYKLCGNCEKKVEQILSQPINSLKELNISRTHVKTMNRNDSVFAEQKNKRTKNWFSFLAINLLENMSLFCAFVLFIIGINELQESSELSLIELPAKLTHFLSVHFPKPLLMIVIGFLGSFIALMMSGKESLLITNVFSQLLWIVCLLINIPSFIKSIHKNDLILLRPILCVFLVILSPINTSVRLFVLKRKPSSENNSLIGHKKTETLSHKTNVCLNKRNDKIDCKENSYINSNSSADQIIREQIKSLCIFDDSDNKPMRDFSRDSKSPSIKSSLSYENNYSNKIVLPAKFNYESIAQTSWVSPFKPYPTQSISPRKENLNSTLFTNCHRFASSSHWINHNITGLVTPPPSAPASISSESAFVNRYPLVDSTVKPWPHIYDYQRNSFYSDAFLRTRFIGKYRENSIGMTTEETSINGSFSTQSNDQTSSDVKYEKKQNLSLTANLTQTFVFAIFLLLLFCFVIFLSLPVVFKTSCDFNSMNFQFTVESVPQNNYCIK